jgi:hypothetical protein
LDIVGTTYEFIFYRKDMKTFIEKEFDIFSKEYNKIFPINLNTMGLKDRANLILINCINYANFLINKKCQIDLGKFNSSIKNFYYTNSYVMFFNNNDFDKIISRELRPKNILNFSDIYNENNSTVEDMFQSIKIIIDTEENIFKINFEKIAKYYKDLINIMYKNYVLPVSILIKELNKTEYIDFIYKIVFFGYIKREIEKNKKISISQIKDIINRLDAAYLKIKNDKDIEIYQKILLLINIYLSRLFKYDKEITYLNLNKVDKESSLSLSINFLKDFIDELDYESNFYYPLLLIDGGSFNFKYKYDFQFRTYGVNMNSIEQIKKHLKNLIPNIIIISDKCKKEHTNDYGYVMSQTGIVTLYTELLGHDFDKKEDDYKKRKHKAFILFRVFFHELFGHKKSSFSKDCIGRHILSANCFKDEIDGKFKFLPDENNDDIYKDINELDITEIKKSTGDSGYFLEYYFGKINNEYLIDILDDYENKIYLGILLDLNLLHKKMNEFHDYIKLKKYMIDNGINKSINDNTNIKEQIDQMKNIIDKEKGSEEISFSMEQKVEFNFFNENKEAFDTLKHKKKKKKLTKGLILEKKIVQIDSLFEEAFHPFDIDKILKLEDKYPNAFFKK